MHARRSCDHRGRCSHVCCNQHELYINTISQMWQMIFTNIFIHVNTTDVYSLTIARKSRPVFSSRLSTSWMICSSNPVVATASSKGFINLFLEPYSLQQTSLEASLTRCNKTTNISSLHSPFIFSSEYVIHICLPMSMNQKLAMRHELYHLTHSSFSIISTTSSHTECRSNTPASKWTLIICNESLQPIPFSSTFS